MSELDFLAKVTSFVSKYDQSDDYAQKIWPAKPPQEEKSPKEPNENSIRNTPAKSPGKTYLDIESGTEWFGRSIEIDNQETKEINTSSGHRKSSERQAKPTNNLSTGAALLRRHISATEPEKQKTPPVYEVSPKKEIETKQILPPQSPTVHITSSLTQSRKEQDNVVPNVKTATRNIDIPSNLERSRQSSLQPEKNSANEEFYSKLVAGLRKITTPEPEHAKEAVVDQDIYRKYSHHLGRAEFGSLKRRDSAQNSSTNLKYHSRDSVYNNPSRGLSRDPSFDKINVKL